MVWVRARLRGPWQGVSGASAEGVALDASVLRYDVLGLDSGVVYEVQASTLNSAGRGAWTASVEGTPTARLAFSRQQSDLFFWSTGRALSSPVVLPAAELGLPPYTYGVSGLPSGLTFDASAAVRALSGVPEESSSSVLYVVRDALGGVDEERFAIVVRSLSVGVSGVPSSPSAPSSPDGLLIVRYLLGVRGEPLVLGQSSLSPASVLGNFPPVGLHGFFWMSVRTATRMGWTVC